MKHKKEKIVEVQPFLPDDYFESNELKQAVWQYLMDHSRPIGNGEHKILFVVTTPEELFRRIKARKDGKYKRYDLWKLTQSSWRRDTQIWLLKKDVERIKSTSWGKLIYKWLLWLSPKGGLK